MLTILLFFITLTTAAKQKTFAESYHSTMKDNNGRVTYDGTSPVLVLFYFEKEQNMSLPSYSQTFIVPNDEMTKLKINNFYSFTSLMKNGNVTYTPLKNGTDPSVKKVATELYCRILVNYRYSDPIKVAQIIDETDGKGQHKAVVFPKFISARVELDKDSRVSNVTWDHDNCETCDKNKANECFDNFCTFTDSHFGSKTCGEAQKQDKSACGLIIYFGWKGPAHAGFTTQYLKSYRNLPTHYTKYSANNQFINAAGDIESDWLKFKV